tara:strand:- start:769 stop:1626 length:858 start_codon:yes stop_codon:yes gene_type:complete
MSQTTYNEAISMFYKLKSNYEINKLNHIKELKSSKNVSPPRCISCNRHVGTTFSARVVKDDKLYGRRLTATCGDTSNPCDLKIHIDTEFFHMYKPIINSYLEKIEEHKQEIINMKNNKLFYDSGNDVDVSKFDNQIELMKEDTKMYMMYKDQYNNSIFKKDIENNKEELIEKINNNKKLIKEYLDTKDSTILTTIIDTYNHEIIPIVNKIRTKSYDSMLMIKDKDNYLLVQNKNKLSDHIFPKDGPDEYTIKEFDGVYKSNLKVKTIRNKKNIRNKTSKKLKIDD